MINEVNYLVNELDISTKHAEEIINIYFDENDGLYGQIYIWFN